MVSRPTASLAEALSRRTTVLVAIVALHVAGFYALAQSRVEVDKPAPTTVAVILTSARPVASPPALPDPLRPVAVAVQAVPTLRLPPPDLPVQAAPTAPSAITLAAATPGPSERIESDVPIEVSAIEYLREPRPRYPAEARKRRVQGVVLVRVLVDEDGKPCDVRIERSSGHEDLDAAARDAVRRAMFKPYLENGVPRMALALVPIEFSVRT